MQLINKQKLIVLVRERLHPRFHLRQIENVVSQFIEEFGKELEETKEIDIPNFASFCLEKNKPRKFYYVRKKCFSISTPKFLLKIRLSHPFRDKLLKHLDFVKTLL